MIVDLLQEITTTVDDSMSHRYMTVSSVLSPPIALNSQGYKHVTDFKLNSTVILLDRILLLG